VLEAHAIQAWWAAFLHSIDAAIPSGVGPDTYFLKPGYRSRDVPEYCVGDGSETTYQPDVYTFAAVAARSIGATALIDIGCGRARKLVASAGTLDTTGIDFEQNIEYCRRQYPTRTWRDCDLDRPHNLPVTSRDLERSVIICADVIEHLVHPEHLLASLREALRRTPLLIVSTPERDLVRGIGDFGPPDNPCHVREWNLAEFTCLLEHYGLRPARVGLTRSDDRDNATYTIMAVVRGTSLGHASDARSSDAAAQPHSARDAR
jgi:hypothetical protein